MTSGTASTIVLLIGVNAVVQMAEDGSANARWKAAGSAIEPLSRAP